MEIMKSLINFLNERTKEYDEGHPTITDAEWDKVYFELQEMEKKTGIIYPNSPTQTIHYEVVNGLEKVEHSHKMLSLEKTKSEKEVADFIKNKNFLAMFKMDGLTCSLTYRDGNLVAAETRGNGLIGENILHNAKVIPSIPKEIPYKGELVIDGEIICSYSDFEDFKEEYKNPRNFAAGSIRLLESKECAKRKLTFVAWDVITQIYSSDNIEYRVGQKLEFIKDFGFTIVPYVVGHGLFGEEEIKDLIEALKNMIDDYSYPLDGIVFKFADCEYGRSLGETSHHFKNALAFKFFDETYETKLLDVEWTMGRTGVLTPVAIFEPVDIDGSTVERASLHNLSIMKELLGQPYKNQKIWITKRNMIIPQIEFAEKLGQSDVI
jgi:DNA ligase (NAD+)